MLLTGVLCSFYSQLTLREFFYTLTDFSNTLLVMMGFMTKVRSRLALEIYIIVKC